MITIDWTISIKSRYKNQPGLFRVDLDKKKSMIITPASDVPIKPTWLWWLKAFSDNNTQQTCNEYQESIQMDSAHTLAMVPDIDYESIWH